MPSNPSHVRSFVALVAAVTLAIGAAVGSPDDTNHSGPLTCDPPFSLEDETVDAWGSTSSTTAGAPIVAESQRASETDSAIDVATRDLLEISVRPALASVALGQTIAFKVIGRYSDRDVDLTSVARLSASQASVTTIDRAGVAFGIAKGISIIRANVHGRQANAALAVTGGKDLAH